MEVITLAEPGRLCFEQRADPGRATGTVLLKMKRLGVCGTDLHAYRGRQPYFRYPRILGHEICATLEEPLEGFERGELVTVMPYRYCGTCRACKSGKTNCCRELSVIGVHEDGGMAGYLRVRQDLVLSGQGLSADALAVAEPFSIAAHALRRVNLGKDDAILVIGAGPIGHCLMRLALANGLRTVALERSPERIIRVGKVKGVNVLDAGSPELNKAVEDCSNGQGFDVIFDATGSLNSIEGALQYLGHGGTLVLVGIQQEAFRFSHPDFHRKEATVMALSLIHI